MILQALAGTEMAMRDLDLPVVSGSGVAVAEEHFRETAPVVTLIPEVAIREQVVNA